MNRILPVHDDIETSDRNRALDEALATLRHGELVGVPTETVYGLAADATSARGVAKIFQAKRRPSFNPLISHCFSFEQAARHGRFGPMAATLADAFWPGPLTLVVPRVAAGVQGPEGRVHDLATAGLDSIALRMPAGSVLRDLARLLGAPIAAPSANRSGRLSTTTATAVAEEFENDLTLILDAGATPVGIESTVVGCLEDQASLLRPGGLPQEQIESVLGIELASNDEAVVRSPGTILAHYAPRSGLRMNATRICQGEAALLFGTARPEGLSDASTVLNLSKTGDLMEAAANLFRMLRDLDRAQCTRIAVAPVPCGGLGDAINDRLARAAASSADTEA